MRTSWSLSILIAVGLFGATLVTYWPALNCGFVNFDDHDYVIDIFDRLKSFSWTSWNYFWSHKVSNNWHPLTMFSLAVDAHLWGLNPAGYHATNVVFHGLNSLLLFLVLRRMTGSLLRSAAVAALFGLHPMHVESVAWVSERKDVLSVFFLLLTLAAYARFASRPSLARYCPVLVLMTLGLLSKPMLVTLPILLLLLDAWPLDRIEGLSLTGEPAKFVRRAPHLLLAEKLPLLALAFLDGLVTLAAQKGSQQALSNVRFDARLAHMFSAYFWYLQKTLLPVNLIILYPHPGNNVSPTNAILGLLVFVAITLIAVRNVKTRPHLLVGWAWFVISLLPVIGLIQVGLQAYADRYVYLPHIGLLIALVWEVASWFPGKKAVRIAGAVAFALICVTCGALSHAQIGYWKDSGTLWTHALDVTPDNGEAHICLGSHLVTMREFESACQHFERGFQLTRQFGVLGYCDWGIALNRLDRPVEAEQKLKACLKIDPNNRTALSELIRLLINQRRSTEAAEYSARYDKNTVRQTTASTPDAGFEVDLGMRKIREGNIQEARSHFERATQLAPQSAAAFYNLANAQKQLRELSAAKQNFLKAIELNPKLSGAHYNLAAILELEHDLDGARQRYEEAYRINPQDTFAKQQIDRLSNPK